MIPGAVTARDFFRNTSMARDRDVVCYCGIGGRSGQFMKELIASEGDRSLWRSLRNFETSMIGWCHAGGPLVDPAGQATKRVHGWAPQFAAMYPQEGFVVVTEPTPSLTVWKHTAVLVGGG